MIIKASTALRNSFPEISELAKETICSHLKINNINISNLNIDVAKP